jgi:predicted enzyme related to lactoylglutathione lyase
MAKVLGIGGVFFKSKDQESTRAWYARVLGIEPTPWGGTWFPAPDFAAQPGAGAVFNIMGAEGEYLQPSTAEFMINLVVDDLDGVLARARSQGVEPVKLFPEEANGRFAHIIDPEGRKVELWEPKPFSA